ncbi:MAG: exodeoxyribonuclease VII large subunit [Rickettsiales bacterium]|jgi:exodeoxyribonuclease VII large subunit|nr:exodeoxyribonuclease VII large subunit [Rickettsiales bacterium]
MQQNTDNIFTVSEAAGLLKSVVEGAFAGIKVRGELSGITRAASGHIYLSIKDSGAVINCIIWRGTPVKFDLADGVEVIASGKFTTYPARSNYQLIVNEMEIAGAGALLKMLEDRKRKLAAEGLFDASRKRPLPRFPAVIGVVTSPTGAAFQDICNKLRDRLPATVLLYPAQVQGAAAAAEIAAGINYFSSMVKNSPSCGGELTMPDVIIVARGGGSLEDLLPFSEEMVVRAVANCAVPVITGVGHEPDWTLVDFAADVRAPTPTGAAEIAVPTRLVMSQEIANLAHRINQNFTTRLQNARARIDAMQIKSPRQMILERSQRLDDIAKTMSILMDNKMKFTGQSVDNLGKLLNSLSYKNTLNRGFAIVRDADKKIISSVADRPASIEFGDGTISVVIPA